MTVGLEWLAAFPIQPATEAVDALLEAWGDLAVQPRHNFNPKTKEPDLTKALKIYVETVTAPKRGILGMWAAEDVFGDVDPATGQIVEQRRTDIVYGWNDAVRGIQLVFEFKRLGRQKPHRDHYLGPHGLRRFVDGIYSRHQAVAAMVGVLLDPKIQVVPPLLRELSDKAVAAALRLRPAPDGRPYFALSDLFPAVAELDTEHERDPAIAPSHGTIRVAHFFLEFGYATSTAKRRTTVTSTAY